MEVSTVLVDADGRWHGWAACAHAGCDGFFGGRRGSGGPGGVCEGCPVAELCLWAGLALEEVLGYRFGVWGGTVPARRARIAAGLPAGRLGVWYVELVAAWQPPAARRESSVGLVVGVAA